VGGCACPFIRGNHGGRLCRKVGRSFACSWRNGFSGTVLTGCLMLPAGRAGDNLGDNADYMVDLTETSPKPLVEHVNLEPEELKLLFWGCPVRDLSGMFRVNIGFWKTIATNLSTVFRSIPGISNQFGLSGANL